MNAALSIRREHKVWALVLLVCAFTSPICALGADERIEESTLISLRGPEVDESRLAAVRAGTATPAIATQQQLSVILWDEVRVPAPSPVRNSVGDSRVTTQMNTFRRP